MRGANQLHAAFRDGSGGLRFQFPANFVNDNHFRVMIFHRFNHDLVLKRRSGHLHAPGGAYRGVRHVSISANFVGGIHNNHAPRFRQYSRGFAQHGGLANARFSQNQDALTGMDQIRDDINRAVNSPTDAAGEPNDFPPPVANRGNAVQCAFHPRPIIRVKIANAFCHVIQVKLCNELFGEGQFGIHKAGGRQPAKVQNYLQQFIKVILGLDRARDFRRQHRKHRFQVVSDFFLSRRHFFIIAGSMGTRVFQSLRVFSFILIDFQGVNSRAQTFGYEYRKIYPCSLRTPKPAPNAPSQAAFL